MRVIMEARFWNTELLMAVEDRWKQEGRGHACSYITQHRQAALDLARAGRQVLDIQATIRQMTITDPISELAALESKYEGSLLPLQRYLMSERYFVGRSRHWQLEQLAAHARFIDDLFEREKPDLFVGDMPDLMTLWLAFDMAPYHGCEPVGMGASSFPPGRLLLVRGHREIRGAREGYERFRAEGLSPAEESAARSLQAIVSGQGTLVDYRPPPKAVADFARRILTGEVVRNHLTRSVSNARERAAGTWYTQPDPIVARIAGMRHGLRATIADRRYLIDEVPKRPYAFYPLHLEPEAALLVHSSYFEQQLPVIRNIARSLPVEWELVVKEHPQMRGMRPLRFYRALRSIPNLRLLPFERSTNEVIMNAQVVAVISGTVGLEACVIGKPVLMFGEIPWDYAPTVRRVGKLDELPQLIAELAKSELGPDHRDVLAFAASWDASLPKVRFFKHRGYDWMEPENVQRMADALAAKGPSAIGSRQAVGA